MIYVVTATLVHLEINNALSRNMWKGINRQTHTQWNATKKLE